MYYSCYKNREQDIEANSPFSRPNQQELSSRTQTNETAKRQNTDSCHHLLFALQYLTEFFDAENRPISPADIETCAQRAHSVRYFNRIPKYH